MAKPKVETADTTELVAVLPGEQKLDATLMDEAVAQINRIYIGKGLEMYRAVGEYLLQTFWEGDLDAFKARSNDHVTFRALAKRKEDLAISHSSLWYCVALLDQLRLLPEDIATALPMSHHRLLVHVPDEKKRIALAKKAATKGLSKRELAEEIKKGKKSDGRGRPALPTFQKTLNLFQRVLSADDAFEDMDQIDEMDADKAKELHDTVLDIKAKCQEIQDKLQPRIPGFE